MACAAARSPDAIRADWTVTFAYPKWCHYLRPAAEYCGEVIVAQIGIPDSVLSSIKPDSLENGSELWLSQFPWPRDGGHIRLRRRPGYKGVLS